MNFNTPKDRVVLKIHVDLLSKQMKHECLLFI